jgi:hypothetical protein
MILVFEGIIENCSVKIITLHGKKIIRGGKIIMKLDHRMWVIKITLTLSSNFISEGVNSLLIRHDAN